MAVMHLKYRPLKIEDLDSIEVRGSLKKILSSKNQPQAFLFAGPKGSGKTSAARIVARVINCENPKNGDACGVCKYCKSIVKGNNNLDIVEIDAASNRGIDDVRVLRDNAYLSPANLKKKVYIIDEVHMMTREAFNALLKLLEEPPEHVVFILCTTDWGKIPDTVMSRLVRVNFKKGNKEEIFKSLKRCGLGEGIDLDEGLLELIYQKSEGSFRNAQRILSELMIELADDINNKKAWSQSVVLDSSDYIPADLENDLASKGTKTVLERLEKMADKGADFGSYRNKLIEYFQSRMLSFFGIGEEREGELTKPEIMKFLNLLIAAGKIEKDVEIEQLPLELAVVEFGGEKKETGNEKVETGNGKRETGGEKVETKKEKKETINEVNVSVDVESIRKDWGKLLEAVKPFNHSVEAFLRSARPKGIVRNKVQIEVFYPFHKIKLEEEKNRRIVEDGLKSIFGDEFLMECVLAKEKGKPIEINNNTVMELEQNQENKVEMGEKEIYDVAKEIFG